MVLRHASVLVVLLPLAMGGCARLSDLMDISGGDRPAGQGEVAVLHPGESTTRPLARPGGPRTGPAGQIGLAGQQVDALDRTSPEERAAALAPPAARTQLLGETLASLGSPADPGLWLRTGLVAQVTQGRVETQDGSGSLRVELRPSGAVAGSGSQLSLSGFTTLGLPLTQLVTLRVYAE